MANKNQLNRQQELKEAEAKRKEEFRIKQATEKAQNEIMGTYKRTVIDSYLKTYADNYGGTFDKNSLINSLSFSYKIDKYNNLSPDFTFNNNGVKFKSDFNKEYKKFNENAVYNYNGRDTQIDPDLQDIYNFGSLDEKLEYEQSGNEYDELNKIESEFIPTSDVGRYGKFNKINKLAGYTPKDVSDKNARKQSETLWNKIKTSVTKNIFKKMKL